MTRKGQFCCKTSSVRKLLFLVLLFLSSSTFVTVTTAVSSSSSDDEDDTGRDDISVGTVVLTSTNFGKNIGDGSVWLVEFYAPWCKHCMTFAPTYSEIARHFHSDPDSNIRVGKVDTTTEKALGQRFSVNAFPTFFVVHGSRVYEFEGSYSKSNLIRFATKGYKDEKPIPFYSSPMGPLGRLQGFLIWAGVTLMSFFSWVQNITGLSPILVGCLLCVLAVFGGMAIMIILVIALTPREKVD